MNPGLRRIHLRPFTQVIEQRLDPTADVEAAIAHERVISSSLGGRTVQSGRQLALFSEESTSRDRQ